MKVQCEKCGRALVVPEDAAGKKLKCPVCGHVFELHTLELRDEIRSSGPAQIFRNWRKQQNRPSPRHLPCSLLFRQQGGRPLLET